MGIPGGKVEPGEQPEEAIVREIKEELGLDIAVVDLIHAKTHVYSKEDVTKHVLLLFYRATKVDGELSHIQCQDSRWVDLAEMDRTEFLVSNYGAVDKYLAL